MPLLSFPHLNVPPPPLPPPPPPPPAVKRSISAPAAVEDPRFEGGVDKFNESFKARYTRARLPTIEVYIIMQKCLSISQDLRSIWGEAGGDHRDGPSPPETPRTPLEALSGGETAAAFPFNTPMENSLPPSEENLESSRYRWRNSHIFVEQMYTFFIFPQSVRERLRLFQAGLRPLGLLRGGRAGSRQLRRLRRGLPAPHGSGQGGGEMGVCTCTF